MFICNVLAATAGRDEKANRAALGEAYPFRLHAPTRPRNSNQEPARLAEIGKRLGRKGPAKVALVAKPETTPGWLRKLVAQKFDGSRYRSYPGSAED